MRLRLFSMARTLLENPARAWRDSHRSSSPTGRATDPRRGDRRSRRGRKPPTGKPMLLRLGLSRTFESEPHYRALAAMVVEHAPPLVGLDVLGIVTGPDTEPLPARAVDDPRRAARAPARLTIHAGEFAGPRVGRSHARAAPRGIGHGVTRSRARDARAAAREGVTLEVCPTSNRLLIPTCLAALERAMARCRSSRCSARTSTACSAATTRRRWAPRSAASSRSRAPQAST